MKRRDKAILWEVRKATGSLPPLIRQDRVGFYAVRCAAHTTANETEWCLQHLGFEHVKGEVWERKKPPFWKLFAWWMQDFQPMTWMGHVAVTALAPMVLLFVRVPVHPAVVACWVAGYFGYREIADYRAKEAAGTLYKQDRQGISGFVDGIVDWGGPVAVAFTYAMAAFLERVL